MMLAIFDKDEYICSPDSVYGVNSEQLGLVSWNQFFCINPLLPNATRKDSNVAVYRNILLEFDKGSPVEQLNLLTDIPHTMLTWSGGKSHHAIISLVEPCANRAEYDALVRRVYQAVPQADQSTKNPSRLSRTPGALRDNGNEQYLVHVKRRVSREELTAWLGPEKTTAAPPEEQMTSLHISPWTRYFLYFGAEPGKRNSELFKAACDLLRHGWSESRIEAAALEVLDLPRQEVLQCIKSAAKAVKE